jgi:hypothetical protein
MAHYTITTTSSGFDPFSIEQSPTCVLCRAMKFAYRKKFFLDPDSPGDTSSVLLEAEDSENGNKVSGQYTVAITDNHRRVNLDFYLGTAKHRRQSMKKIDTLITQLVRFGHTLMTQAQAIEKASKTSKPTKSKTRKGKK